MGYSLCRSWIRCATVGKYLIAITMFIFLQMTSQRYFFSTLESKSYGIPKDISSMFTLYTSIRSVYEIHTYGYFCYADWLWLLSGFVHLTLSTFIGYRGGKRNKNSWIAFFGILQGIFAILLAVTNASDHYNYYQRPSAIVLASPGNYNFHLAQPNNI